MPHLTCDFQSTAMRSAAYDTEAQTLDITWTSGATNTYEAVPERVFLDLRDATSPGSFYHANIKDRY